MVNGSRHTHCEITGRAKHQYIISVRYVVADTTSFAFHETECRLFNGAHFWFLSKSSIRSEQGKLVTAPLSILFLRERVR